MFSEDTTESFKIQESLNILGFEEDLSLETKQFILNEISKYIFDINKQGNNETPIFDIQQDFKYYFNDFLDKGINLLKDEISWLEFNMILDGIFLQEHSCIGKVIGYRTYEKPPKNYKTSEEKEHRFYMKMKREYALKLDNTKKIDENMNKMWSYLEKKAGDNNE